MIWRELTISVYRTARKKTLHIVIERDGAISVQAPARMTDEQIVEILNQKEYEIFQKKTLWLDSHREGIVRQYLSGQSFLYLGKNYNLTVVKEQKRHLIFKNGNFYLSSNVLSPREAFVRFYKRQAKIKILERVEIFRSQISTMPKAIQIKEMPTRWGSCTPAGNVYYNWRCVMVPLFVLDYLVVHELVHLEQPDHSREFWQRVSAILPDYNYACDWLRINGVRTNI